MVDPPSETQKLGWWLTDMLPLVLAGLTLAGVIGFLVYAYRRAGRDPDEGTVVPLFAPPDELTPAGMRYLVEQGFDNRAFAAALIDAGVKGHVILGEDKGFLFFGGDKYIQGATGPKTPLPAAEQNAISLLVSPGEKLELDNKNHSIFSAAKKKLETEYKNRFEGKLFHRNRHVGRDRGRGVAGRRLCAPLCRWRSAGGMVPTPIIFAAPIAGGAVAFVLYRMAKKSERSTGSCLFNVLALFVAFGALGLTMLTLVSAITTLRWEPMVLVALGLPIALSSLFWISAPTKEGRAILDRIAGFKQYLSITETRPARPHAGAARHAADVRALASLCRRAGGREPLGRSLLGPARGGRGGGAVAASPGTMARTARGPTPAASSARSARRCRVRSAPPRPRRDRRAARAAAGRRVAAAAVAAAAAGN